MSIRFTEKPGSRNTVGGESGSRVDLFTLSGTNDSEVAYFTTLANTALFVVAAGQILFRQDPKIEHQGHDLWSVEVPYGRKSKESVEWRVSSSTTGRTQRITQSKNTVKIFGPANPPAGNKGAIDVQNGEVRGVDIILPSTRLTYEITWPAGVVSEAYILFVSQQVGKTNANYWHGMKPGEGLFSGHTVEQGSAQKRVMRFDIEYSPELPPTNIAGIAGVTKRGWDVAWESRIDDVDNGKPVKPAVWIYVERVYDEIDFASVMGF